MHLGKAFAAATFLFATLGLAGCGAGVEGNYLLDKAEMKKKAEAEVAKLPEDQKETGKLALKAIEGLEMTFELQSGGVLTVHATTPGLQPGQPNRIEQKDGTWKVVGETIELTVDGKTHTCTKAPGKLTCTGDNKDDAPLVLVKG